MHRSSNLIDEASRLKQFAWEQWDDQIIAVIFRPGQNGHERYVVKRYAEQVLYQSERWKQLSIYFLGITPSVRSYAITSYEVDLMRRILDYHLNDKLHLRITPSNDQLIEYEALLDFINHVHGLLASNSTCYNNIYPVNGKKLVIPSIPVIPSTYILPPTAKSIISPLPELTITKTSPSKPLVNRNPLPLSRINRNQGSKMITNGHHISSSTGQNKPDSSKLPELCPTAFNTAKIDGSGWMQINNVCLPYIIKNNQRLVPYQVLVSCKILVSNELRPLITHATSADTTLINSMIQDSKLINEKIPENASLINVHHVLKGAKEIMYIKILPQDNPISKINRQYKSILSLQGGTIYINTRLVPFVYSRHHIYIPLNDVLIIYSTLQSELKTLARAPRTNELEYLQLIQLYYNENELPSDTLLINMDDLNKMQIISSENLTLNEYHAKEKAKLDQHISVLNKSLSQKKRKNQQPHENRQKFKSSSTSSNQFRQPTPAFIRPPTGYYPAPRPITVTPPNPFLASNNGHRGRPRLQ